MNRIETFISMPTKVIESLELFSASNTNKKRTI